MCLVLWATLTEQKTPDTEEYIPHTSLVRKFKTKQNCDRSRDRGAAWGLGTDREGPPRSNRDPGKVLYPGGDYTDTYKYKHSFNCTLKVYTRRCVSAKPHLKTPKIQV